MERKRWGCSALPNGWKREEVTRKSGLSAGKSDVYYFSPTGKKFRSKPQLARYLGNSMDLSSFDFRTGKMLMSKLSKNRQRTRLENSQNKGKPDLNTSLPVRQTASIFKQPVTKVTNHPSNKVKTDTQKAVEQPRQLFWEKKLSGLHTSDISEELMKTMDLPKGLQGVGPGYTDKTLIAALASALHTSSSPITGQLSAAVEKNPGVWLNTTQPLCKSFLVTDDDIRYTHLHKSLPLCQAVPCDAHADMIMPSPLFRAHAADAEPGASSGGPPGISRDPDAQSRQDEQQEALRFALDQLSRMALEEVEGPDGTGSDRFIDLQLIDHPGSRCPSPEFCGTQPVPCEQNPLLRKRSVNMTECVPVPTSEHVAEIVGRQGCKIKALRAKTNTYIKTPVRGEDPVFIVTGRREDVEMAKREIVSAAEHFSMIRASRCKAGGSGPASGGSLPGPPNLPGQTTIQVRVPYRVVGLVVGPKGATIKRIQQQTHTYIVTPSREKDPVFEVTGMPENVDRAREEIETHITLRTGAFVDLQGDNDFHSNGTDVSLEGLGMLGLGGTLWSRASHSAPPPPATNQHSTRKMSSASYSNGALSSESFSATRRTTDGGSPTSPFSTSSAGGSFSFGGDSTPGLPGTSEDPGFEFSGSNIWAPFLNGGKQQPQVRRNSSGLSGGAVTPRLSPTLPSDPSSIDHPLARRAQSDPLSALSWLQASGGGSFSGGSSSSGGSSTGYSSCSASSLPGGSPTDSEGGGSGVGIASSVLGRLKAGGLAVMVPGGSKDCYVCCESEVTAALVPCGHNLFCMDCAGQICQSQDAECPVCRTPATQCIRIFS